MSDHTSYGEHTQTVPEERSFGLIAAVDVRGNLHSMSCTMFGPSIFLR